MSRQSNKLVLKEVSRRIKVSMAYYNIGRKEVVDLTGMSEDDYGAGLQGRSMKQAKIINEALKTLGVPKAFLLLSEDNNFVTLEEIIVGFEDHENKIQQVIAERNEITKEYTAILEAYMLEKD